ncbi:MAG: hypothetical protein PHO41_09860, partial [Eubacteriales bacterium]|nr:hypothetical protein [Eubacteriales bacterium]
ITNNSASTSTTYTNSNSASSSQGTVSSVEDWNVDTWQNPNNTLDVTYEPFNPYATATPTPTPTTEAVAGETTATESPTAEIGTMIPISYADDTKDTETGGGWGGLAIGVVALLGAAGGVYAYALRQNKKRKTAARNAAYTRRAAQQSSQQSATTSTATTNPYTRRAVAAPPVSAGTDRKNEPGGTQSSASGTANVAGSVQRTGTPYTGSSTTPQAPNPYARPAGSQPASPYAAPAKPEESAAPAEPTPAEPVKPANPYATPKTGSSSDTDSINPTPRRSSRASRYHHDSEE